jgi:hypothetical protein
MRSTERPCFEELIWHCTSAELDLHSYRAATGTIIFDNWQQRGAFMSPQAEPLMQPFVGTSYAQPERAHDKHSWQTAIWHLP